MVRIAATQLAEFRFRQVLDLAAACGATPCNAVSEQCRSLWYRAAAETPTIVPVLLDESGAPMADVTVTIDGEAVASRLDGRPIAIDPGVHEMGWYARDRVAIFKKLLIRERERNLPLVARLERSSEGSFPVAGSWPTTSNPPPPPPQPVPAPPVQCSRLMPLVEQQFSTTPKLRLTTRFANRYQLLKAVAKRRFSALLTTPRQRLWESVNVTVHCMDAAPPTAIDITSFLLVSNTNSADDKDWYEAPGALQTQYLVELSNRIEAVAQALCGSKDGLLVEKPSETYGTYTCR